MHGQKLLGFLGISTAPELDIDAEERSLVLETAGDLAYALNAIASERQGREANERFKASFEQAPIGKA